MSVKFKNGSQSVNLSKNPSSRRYQPAQGAGVHSSVLGISYEPALQHKRRIDGPPTSLSSDFYEAPVGNQRQYALLGQQEKFSNNVRYPLKGTLSSVQSSNLKDNVGVDRKADDKDASPSKQIKIDLKRNQLEEIGNVRAAQTEVKNSMETPKSPPPAPRKLRKVHGDAMKLDMPDKNLSDVLQKEVARGTERKVEPEVQEHENRDKNELPKSETKDDQENLQATHALKYKAGIAPSRKTSKISEYKKEFNWKQGSPASPLLTAEKMIHKGSLQNVPQRIKPSSRSEYQRQFQPWKLQDSDPWKTSSIQDYHPKVQEHFQVKRSKSVGDNLPAAGSNMVTSWQDPHQVQQSADNAKAFKNSKPHIDYGKLRRTLTEYQANYKSPTSCSYDQGAWRGAHPPHLFQEKLSQVTEQEPGEERETRLSNWFAEVLELRQRALEYKRRAQGTHFSREHLAQLLAQQTGSWDISSTDSVTSLDALALEPGPIYRSQPVGQSGAQKVAMSQKGVQNKSSVHKDEGQQQQQQKADGKGPKAAWEEKVEDAKKAEAKATMVSDDQLDNDGEWKSGAEHGLELKVCESNEKNTPEDAADIDGRMPTPVLRQQAASELQPKIFRHHLDLTTPCVGGVLLSSSDDKVVTSRSGDSCLTKLDECISPKQTSSVEKLLTSPIYGKPTPDTHVLRDDDSSSDRALETQYMSSPPPAKASPYKEKISKFQDLALRIPKTIDEKMGDTYKVTQTNFKLGGRDKNSADDDLLSMSTMSIASSSSRACEVYERAKKRRDHFWSQKSGPAAS